MKKILLSDVQLIFVWLNLPTLGTGQPTETDEFSEKFQAAFDKSVYVHYGGTVVYYMILFPMRCM